MSVLAGCATVKPLPPSEHTSIDLRIHWEEPEYVTERAHLYGHRGKTLGLAVWDDIKGIRICDVYAPKPYGADDYKWLIILGHEIFHCTEGHYHE